MYVQNAFNLARLCSDERSLYEFYVLYTMRLLFLSSCLHDSDKYLFLIKIHLLDAF